MTSRRSAPRACCRAGRPRRSPRRWLSHDPAVLRWAARAPADCRWRCALEVIDELLGHAHTVTGEEADLLLDLRWKLGKSEDAEGALRLFCDLRLRMEQRHYLAFFRIRRWLEKNMEYIEFVVPIQNSLVKDPVQAMFCGSTKKMARALAAAAAQSSSTTRPGQSGPNKFSRKR